jgi:hypothetical protein
MKKWLSCARLPTAPELGEIVLERAFDRGSELSVSDFSGTGFPGTVEVGLRDLFFPTQTLTSGGQTHSPAKFSRATADEV